MGLPITDQKAVLCCYFLGEPYVLLQGRRVDALAEGKMLGLLAYLIMERKRKHRREFLAELLWPDLPSNQGRTYLRHLLHRLQQTLKLESGESPLHVSREYIGIDDDASVWLDSEAFSEGQQAFNNDEHVLAIMEAKLALYRGPMLDGLNLSASDAFHDWLLTARGHFQHYALQYYDKLAEKWLKLGQKHKALEFALHRANLDVADEPGQQQLMRHQAGIGDFVAMEASFQRLISVLRQELGVSPSQKTLELHSQLLSQELPSVEQSGMDWVVEIRQITVISCAFTSASPSLEERLPYLRNDQIRAIDIIRHLGGHAIKGWHGRVLGYFAYPQARESAALYAAKAALQIRDHFETEVVRIGMHAGALLCDGDMEDPDPQGQVSTLAMQMEGLAASGEIILSEAVATLLGNQVVSEKFSAANGQSVQRLLQIMPDGFSQNSTCFQSRFCGRRAELSRLFEAWRHARHNRGSSVRLVGEPGIGKSRLIYEFSRRLQANGVITLVFRGIAEHSSTPLAPIRNGLEAWAGLKSSFDEAASRQCLQLALGENADSEEALISALLQLLSPVAFSNQGSGSADRAQLFEVLVESCLRWAIRKPILLIFEDLHWMDPSSLELLGLLSRRIASSRILLIASLRPEAAAAIAKLIPGESLTLPALADIHADSLLADNSGLVALHKTQKQRLLQMGQGIPLFLEELARLAAESQQLPISLEQMPPTNLRDLLMTRIDQLGQAKPLVQLAAIYGQELPKGFLQRLYGKSETTFEQNLQILLSRGIMMPGQDDGLRFRHALLQEAAYASLSHHDRKKLHFQVAMLCSSVEFEPVHRCQAFLAHHRSMAGQAREAARTWLAAAQQTATQAAYVETVKLLRNGLAELEELEACSEKSELEMLLLQTLWGPLTVTAGYWSTELQGVSERMQALSASHSAQWDSMFRLLWGNWVISLFHAHLRASYLITAQIANIAQQSQNPILNAAARYSCGDTQFWRGEFNASVREVSAALTEFSEFTKEEQYRYFGISLDILARSILAQSLCYQGELSAAQAVVDAMLDSAMRSVDPHEQVVAQLSGCQLAFFQRDADTALRYADQALQLCQVAELEHWALILNAFRYWALASSGDVVAIDHLEPLIQMGKTAMPAKAASLAFIQAETYYTVGLYRQALALYWQTLRDIRQTGERYRLAESLFRLGDCTQLLGLGQARADCYRQRARRVVLIQGAMGILERTCQVQTQSME